MLESRIFALLENEVGKRLNFTFSLSANITRPGSRTLRAGDYFRFTVLARNDCAFRLTDVRGTINPTELTEFRLLNFDLPELMPTQNVHIGSAGARLISASTQDVFENIGRASVSARLDLSSFKFQQWDKQLVRSAPHSAISEPMLVDQDLGYHRASAQKPEPDSGNFWGSPVLPLGRLVDH